MGCIQAKTVVETDEESVLQQEYELQLEGFDDDAGESAYIPRIERQTSDFISTRWSVSRRALPEYQNAANSICLSTPWLAHTRLLRYIRGTKALLQSNERMKRQYLDKEYFKKLLLQAIRKGYQLSSDETAQDQKDVMYGHNIFSAGSTLWDNMRWRQPYLTHAVKILAEHEEPDAIVAKLTEVCDRATRCSSAQRQAFNVLVAHSYHIIERKQLAAESNPPASPAQPPLDRSNKAILHDFLSGTKRAAPVPDSRQAALLRVYECVEDFLDEFKEKAFASAFVEPARFYFDVVSDAFQRDHVDIHGFNWFLALLHATLGAQVPLLPELHDTAPLGVGDFWAALSDESWAAFSAPENFGKDFQGIRELRAAGARRLKKRVTSEQLPTGTRFAQPKLLGNAAVSGSEHVLRQKVAVYVERFGHFFRAEFLVPRMFETLNAENKPEHAGFRRASEALYAAYRAERGAEEETLVEHVYADEYFSELRVERVLDLLAWCEVVRPRAKAGERTKQAQGAAGGVEEEKKEEAGGAEEEKKKGGGVEEEKKEGGVEEKEGGARVEESREPAQAHGAARDEQEEEEGGGGGAEREREGFQECPICMEERGDVEVLDHWAGEGDVTGDVSSHRMCGQCRARYGPGHGCPFCREVTDKQALLEFISSFLSAAGGAVGDANTSAAVLERWQLLEMEHQAQPRAVARVAKLVLEDPRFLARLTAAVSTKADWVRDMAGIIFRFHGLHVQGRLRTRAEVGGVLGKAVEVVLKPWEAATPTSLHGHYFGALYMQAVVPWLMAFNAGEDHAVLRGLVQRVGRALVKQVQAKGRSERERRELRAQFKERVHLEYLQLSHVPVWGAQSKDPVWAAFFAT